MFRIGIIELGVTCALIALAIVIPLLVTRGYAKLNKRIKNIEERVSKKH
jgi:hypothetical protein